MSSPVNAYDLLIYKGPFAAPINTQPSIVQAKGPDTPHTILDVEIAPSLRGPIQRFLI